MKTQDPRWKAAAEKDSERLKHIQAELRAMADRLRELQAEVGFSPETIKGLPKEYRSKSMWMDFPKAPVGLEKAATLVSSIASDLQMGVNLAEIAESKS